MIEHSLKSPWNLWLWIAAIWGAGGLFDASQTVLIMHAEGNYHPWQPLFTVEFVSWLPWALATPLVIHLARHFPAAIGTSKVIVAVHLTAFILISAFAEAWNATLQVTFDPWGHRVPPTFVDTWSTNLLYQVLTFLIAYALILTATFVMDSRQRLARQETEKARLNEELSNSRLAALRRQMEPHFIFNALNSIAGLVRDQRYDVAVNTLVGLSEFLRRATDDSHRPQVSLAEEVEYLRRYIDIQMVRFGDRLQVLLEIPTELLGAQVPNMLLQPLVENAIKHGIAQRVAGGAVYVRAMREGNNLRITVRNDTPIILKKVPSSRGGVGLDNLRARLMILYKEKADLTLLHTAPTEVEVIVIMPFQAA
jgi:two-component system LytT family sensor kinase